jgi:hypothetical protein
VPPETAKDAIDRLLHDDPAHSWSCAEMALTLSLTIRTVAREVGVLVGEGRAYRAYGRQRKMRFKATVEVQIPRWLMPITTADLELLPVKSTRRYLIEDD